jgi:DNA-binding MarR family transcriptional regulator
VHIILNKRKIKQFPFETILCIMQNMKQFKTYSLGLTQAKSFRLFKYNADQVLKEYGINSIEWATLGLIYEDNKNCIAINKKQIAEKLGLKKPFITKLIQSLKKKKLVREIVNEKDMRSENIELTEKGLEFVEKVEDYLYTIYSKFLFAVGEKEFSDYYKFIQKVATYSDSLRKEYSLGDLKA